VAGRLAEASDRSILLLEAGPDYGPHDSGDWPAALLDARTMPVAEHSWEYLSSARYGKSGLTLPRARVIGGCSSHNGCAAVWGHRADYDGWERLGNPGWSADDLLPYFRAGNERLRVHTPLIDQISPWHCACLAAAPAAGLPVVDELNDFDLEQGIAIGPANEVDGVRWNTAFAYLDPVRSKSTLTICGDVLVDRLHVEGQRVVGLDVIGPDGPARVETAQVVLAAGAYGSPLILLRSGVGPPSELRVLGIEPVCDLPGVGQNLQDHPAIAVTFAGTKAMIEQMEAFEASSIPLREEGTIINARSSRCDAVFDLHLYPIANRASGTWLESRESDGSDWVFSIASAVMTPRSRGTIRLSGRDPEAPPVVDHAYFTDPDDYDLDALLDGLELARSIASKEPLASLAGAELGPGVDVGARAALRAHARANSSHDFHPVGTCKMGPTSDSSAVVDARGRLHGIDGLIVADASIMPVIPRANTNLPALVVGEKIAALLVGDYPVLANSRPS
jgi:choline dehydrogenase